MAKVAASIVDSPTTMRTRLPIVAETLLVSGAAAGAGRFLWSFAERGS